MKLKGQALGGLSSSAIAIIMLVLVVAVGATILATIQTTQLTTASTQINNESNTFKYGTAYTVLNTPLESVVQIRDTTTVLGTANYTVSGNTVTLASVQRVNKSMNMTENFTVEAGTRHILSILDGYNDTIRFTSGNFTIDSHGGLYDRINATANGIAWQSTQQNITVTYNYARYNNSLLNVTYKYTRDVHNLDYNVSGQGLSALGTYSDFFSVIVVVVIFAVIIGLFVYFVGTKKGSGI